MVGRELGHIQTVTTTRRLGRRGGSVWVVSLIASETAKIGNDKAAGAGPVGGHAPGKQSTTAVYRQEVDVVDAPRSLQDRSKIAPRSLQSIGVRRILGGNTSGKFLRTVTSRLAATSAALGLLARSQGGA